MLWLLCLLLLCNVVSHWLCSILWVCAIVALRCVSLKGGWIVVLYLMQLLHYVVCPIKGWLDRCDTLCVPLKGGCMVGLLHYVVCPIKGWLDCCVTLCVPLKGGWASSPRKRRRCQHPSLLTGALPPQPLLSRNHPQNAFLTSDLLTHVFWGPNACVSHRWTRWTVIKWKDCCNILWYWRIADPTHSGLLAWCWPYPPWWPHWSSLPQPRSSGCQMPTPVRKVRRLWRIMLILHDELICNESNLKISFLAPCFDFDETSNCRGDPCRAFW